LGLTIVDSLDTMLVMGLESEYNEAREWVANHLDFDKDVQVNLFETTIRVLGGLLSAYYLTGENDTVLLQKADDLGQRLLPAFDSESGIPFSDVNLRTHKAFNPAWSKDSSTAEVATIQLEFKYLADVTGNEQYRNVVDRVMQQLDEGRYVLKGKKKPNEGDEVEENGRGSGLVPIFVNPATGKFTASSRVTLGARGDSYYEYLLKQWIQSEKTEPLYLSMYEDATTDILDRLLKYSVPNGLAYIAELASLKSDTTIPKMDHLVCFLPGLFALGHFHGVDYSRDQSHDLLEVAKELMETCVAMYKTKTGLAPEIAHFNTGFALSPTHTCMTPRS
jgi:mannosyl-oligosaccharide alpha-1,2-mannosidase